MLKSPWQNKNSKINQRYPAWTTHISPNFFFSCKTEIAEKIKYFGRDEHQIGVKILLKTTHFINSKLFKL